MGDRASRAGRRPCVSIRRLLSRFSSRLNVGDGRRAVGGAESPEIVVRRLRRCRPTRLGKALQPGSGGRLFFVGHQGLARRRQGRLNRGLGGRGFEQGIGRLAAGAACQQKARADGQQDQEENSRTRRQHPLLPFRRPSRRARQGAARRRSVNRRGGILPDGCVSLQWPDRFLLTESKRRGRQPVLSNPLAAAVALVVSGSVEQPSRKASIARVGSPYPAHMAYACKSKTPLGNAPG